MMFDDERHHLNHHAVRHSRHNVDAATACRSSEPTNIISHEPGASATLHLIAFGLAPEADIEAPKSNNRPINLKADLKGDNDDK